LAWLSKTGCLRWSHPIDDADELNAFIARIKSRPLPLASLPTFTEIRAEDWLNPSPEQNANFDPEAWNRRMQIFRAWLP
jgi:hypothetical protein